MQQAAVWINSLDGSDLCLQPFALRKHVETAKTRCADNAFSKVDFAMSEGLEKKTAPGPPGWCAIDRSPESGAAKRRAREAAESIQSKVLADITVEPSSACWRKGGEWARYANKEAKRKKGKHFFGDDAAWNNVMA